MADFPYRLTRLGVVMTPDPDSPDEAEGVLNPGSGRGPDGELYLLPRLVATGNVSRVGLARVVVEDGVPVGVTREGVVLAAPVVLLFIVFQRYFISTDVGSSVKG